jgi:hypoxanthine phosphoribosyltransferase
MMPEKWIFNDIEKILVSEDRIKERVCELAAAIKSDYRDRDILMVGILNGAVCFYVDLIKELDLYLEMNFMRVSSYGVGTSTTGEIRIMYDLEVPLTGKDVLIVEDIIDSGVTMLNLKKLLLNRGAASVKSCVLLDKPSRRVVDVDAEYVGFRIPDEFVVGYGLDYAGKYRNLKFIGTLKPEIYMKD